VGARASDQAANAARDHWATDDVLRRGFNLQYRLKEIDGGTLITLRHTALGLFPDGYREALSQGWPQLFDRVRRRVEKA
jgi:hypothetical protein